MEHLQDFFSSARGEFLGIPTSRYLFMAVAIFCGYLASAIVKVALGRIHKLTEKTGSQLDDYLINALRRPLSHLIVWAGISVAITFIPKEGPAHLARTYGIVLSKLVFILLATWMCFRVVDALANYALGLAKRTDSRLDDQLVPIGRTSIKVFIAIVAGVSVLHSLGYSIGGLLAGMGIGGMAVALAAKDTLANFFGSLLVFLDKPFHVGDWICIDGVEGTVEEVGLRTTKVRTFANSMITLPNSRITTDSIENWSRMQKRRIKMTIGITYASSPDQVKQSVAAIRSLIQTDERFRQDFYLVHFTDFGASSLDIFVYCFTKTTAWAEYLALREEFNLKIMHALKEIGVEFAFPSRTLYLETEKPLQVDGVKS